jgi:hypothetical protein
VPGVAEYGGFDFDGTVGEAFEVLAVEMRRGEETWLLMPMRDDACQASV